MPYSSAQYIVVVCAAVAMASPAVAAESAADYPSKPVRLVVGFSAGSGVDVSARVVAQKLNERWGQPILVDNRPGAGGTIAAGIVAGANPDGYTVISVSAAHVISPSIYPNLKYDTIKDFAGITTTVSLPNLLVVSPSLGVRSVKELVALAREKPGQLMFSSGGVGSGTHFASELFKARARLNVSHVPFKGIPEALTETMTGRVAFTMSPVANVLPQIKAGKLIALAAAPAKRVNILPDLPTMAEAGVEGYSWDTWFGWLVPAKTPRAIVRMLNEEVTRILVLSEVKKHWDAMGAEPLPMTPEQFDKYIAEQVGVIANLVKTANIKIEQ
jgi:tripartite-type tricarboxylate transporter receptor subunit TctC